MGYACCFLCGNLLINEVLSFSSFELVFGHIPHGPLKLLKETWLTTDPPQDVLTQVTDVCHRLLRANKFAKKNLQSAQAHMKAWYDKKAQVTECWHCC